jgi:SAM-dependent methyltransferase
MENWKLKTIVDSYSKTQKFRFNNYIVNPRVQNLMGSVQGKKLLEIGCGFGRYLEIFAKENPLKLVGCDISANQIELCKKIVSETATDIDLHILDFTNENSVAILGANLYDIVYSIFVILYVDTLEKLEIFIKNCYDSLKEGGDLLICTLDILSASYYPEVFNILDFPIKPLENNEYADGSPIEITITDECVVTSYHRNFSTLKSVMEKVGFKMIEKCEIFWDEKMLEGFTREEFNIIKKSDLLLLIKATK